ncbi:FecCD family ABC transporter permease [Microbacterium sp.]|uniref:FecCD family ABC transporter permease n=1 Tax=Microbacterium sp. TaxID=51671 RepID=UPI0039E5BA5C
MTANPIAPASARTAPAVRGLARRRAIGFALLVAALAGAVLLSVWIGANPLAFSDVLAALVRPDGGDASIVVWTKRMPRTLLGLLVGAAIGVAGAVIQAMTRNPLADPGILGVNAGAGFAVTLGVGLFGMSGIGGYIWFSFAGAAAATLLVWAIGTTGRGATPITMVLAGVALGAVLRGISTFLTLVDEETFRAVHNWGLGSIARAGIDETLSVLPFIAIGLVIALLLSGSLNAVALGDDLASSLGTAVLRTRILGLIAVTLLAGAATALTGGIAFIGLMVPHVVRWFTGPDQRWIIAGTALAAPVLLLVADVIGRVIARPGEMEVGIVTAVIGAPVLIALVRRRKASGL